MSLPPLLTDPEVLAGYLTDASNVLGRADALARPRSTEEISELLSRCQRDGTPVLCSAGRTSTTAGAVPDGGVVLSMEGLSGILDINTDRASALAGTMLGAFQSEIESRGRFYPPDPTSRHECTLGASIACNASGARTFRYGATRRWVSEIEVVLPTGEVVTARDGDPPPSDWPAIDWPEPLLKTAAGYSKGAGSWLDLFVGSEGTLGVITRATVKLTALPRDVFGLVAFFPDRAAAVAFMQRARAQAREAPSGPLSPRCVEYYDAYCLRVAQARIGSVPGSARAALFCEQEVDLLDMDSHLSAWLEALGESSALVDDTILATDAPSRERLLALRHAIPAGINEAVVRNGMPKIGTDLAVPDGALDEMMAAYEAAPVEHVLFGHIGDNHLHLNLLPRTPNERDIAHAYYDELARRAIALGGTVSAEHGIGKRKRKHLAWMVGPEVLEQFRALKRHVDPAGILGRGNVFDLG